MAAVSHLLAMVVYACLVGAVGGVLLKDDRAGQVRSGVSIAASLLVGALVLGWIFYAFPL